MPGKLIEWTGVAHNCFTHRPIAVNMMVAFAEESVTYTIKRGHGEAVTLTSDDPNTVDFISRMVRAATAPAPRREP